MEDITPSPERPRRRWGRPAGLIAAGVIAGSILAGTLSAGAQSNSPSSTSSTASTRDESQAGPGETLLTGAIAQQVRAAALGAVPGGTILRVETDAQESPYEAHVRKANGTEVTVKVDKAFKVTAIDTHDKSGSPSA